MRQTENILHYIVKLSESNNPNKILKRTKLVKLLYLVQRKSVLNNDYVGKLPNVTFVKYNYGPYSDEIIDAIDKSNKEHLFHEYTIQTEKGTVYSYKTCNCPMHNSEIQLKEKDKDIIESVFEEYGSMQTKELVETVSALPEVENKEKYSTINPRDIKSEASRD